MTSRIRTVQKNCGRVISSEAMRKERYRVALVSMPFASVRRGSIALGILKAALKRKKIQSDVHMLNLHFAKQTNLHTYESISETSLLGEWIFSQHLFGDHGTRELDNGWETLKKDTLAFRRMVHRIPGLPEMIRRTVPQFLKECIDRIPWEHYDVVGFTSMFDQHLASALLAKMIKQRFPEVRIVFGGANVQGFMGQETLRAFDFIDAVVNGEGEEVFPMLVESLIQGKAEKLPGVSLRIASQMLIDSEAPRMADLSRSPIPDYTDYFLELKASGLIGKESVFLPFEGSRGCWWGEKSHCTFCGLNGQLMKYRIKAPHQIFSELLFQSNKYGVRSFEATDTILREDAFNNLIPLLIEKRPGLEIFYEVKSNLSPKQIQMLQKAGIHAIQPGIESLHTEVLKLMRKGVSAIQNIQLLKCCRLQKISVAWNLLYGFPGETIEHYRQILKTVRLLTHLEPPERVARIIVQRFSPYHSTPQQFGISIRPDSRYRYIYPQNKVDIEKIAFLFDYTHSNHCSDPEPYVEPVKRVVRKWKEDFKQNEILLSWRRKRECVQIMDERPRFYRRAGKENMQLQGLEAEVYAFCDTVRSIREIEAITDRIGPERASRILTKFVKRGWMFSENDHYLSLALPE
jgi:ribosomal peptide maturation radical SAM protein 1